MRGAVGLSGRRLIGRTAILHAERGSPHFVGVRRFLAAILMLGWTTAVGVAATVFEQRFDGVKEGSVPEEFTVLDGQFTVRGQGSDHWLELPGAPLESFGVLFGPAAVSGRQVEARIFGTKTGRKFPTFAAGLNGVNGYKVRVSPAKNAVELVVGDTQEVKGSAPLAWKSGEWIHLKLRVVPSGSGVRVQAKAWQGEKEPGEWVLETEAAQPPPSGMAGVWGMPFSGTPIRFDDLRVDSINPL